MVVQELMKHAWMFDDGSAGPWLGRDHDGHTCQTTPAKRQEKAMNSETAPAPESSILPLDEPQSLKGVTVQFL